MRRPAFSPADSRPGSGNPCPESGRNPAGDLHHWRVFRFFADGICIMPYNWNLEISDVSGSAAMRGRGFFHVIVFVPLAGNVRNILIFAWILMFMKFHVCEISFS